MLAWYDRWFHSFKRRLSYRYKEQWFDIQPSAYKWFEIRKVKRIQATGTKIIVLNPTKMQQHSHYSALRSSSTGWVMMLFWHTSTVQTNKQAAAGKNDAGCLVFVMTRWWQETISAVRPVGPVSVVFVSRWCHFLFVRARLDVTAVILWHLGKRSGVTHTAFT